MQKITASQFHVDHIIACKAIGIIVADKLSQIYSGKLDEETTNKYHAFIRAIEAERNALSTDEAVQEALKKYLPLANAILTANADNPTEEE
jgi:hypothetical protein